jgi:hydroxyethylthiazole kinase-like uncharacterized protein yjeF
VTAPVLDLAALLSQVAPPEADGDKKARGTLLVIGGAATCPGGALLAGTAALRAGAGRVQLVVHPDVAAAVGAALPEAFVIGWRPGGRVPDLLAERCAAADAVLVGPGLGPEGELAADVASDLVGDRAPLMLDASAVGAARRVGHRPLVLAPNPEEAARLLGVEPSDVEEDIAALARAVATKIGQPAAVRGVVSVIADGAGTEWCERGAPSGLGTAGSGDVFAGIAAGLMAIGAEPLAALAWAIAAHVEAGTDTERTVAPVGYLASEVAAAVPAAMVRLRQRAVDG